jgi:hypothetical protein
VDQQPLQTSFSINTEGLSGTDIPFDFNTMPGNQPNNYGNTVFLWQTSQSQIPRNTTPLSTWTVPIGTPDGSGDFGGLSVTNLSYLVGYAVGPAVSNIVATDFIPAGPGKPSHPGASGGVVPPSVLVTVVGTTSVSFKYLMPPGSLPSQDGDWAGIWQGQDESALYSVPPTAFVPVAGGSFAGTGSFNNVPILRGTLYTVGYFKGGYNTTTPKLTTLAASTTFTN